MHDIDYLKDKNIKSFAKAVMVDHHANENIFGKLIGKLKKDYHSLKKSDLFFLSYRKEMYHFHVIISHFDNVSAELTPVEYKIFKNANQLKKYIKNIQEHMGEPSHSFERRTFDMPEIFNNLE